VLKFKIFNITTVQMRQLQLLIVNITIAKKTYLHKHDGGQRGLPTEVVAVENTVDGQGRPPGARPPSAPPSHHSAWQLVGDGN
jgi:hypothetical protein